jgi:hypothetical protein
MTMRRSQILPAVTISLLTLSGVASIHPVGAQTSESEAPEAPDPSEAPDAPEAAEAPHAPDAPEAPEVGTEIDEVPDRPEPVGAAPVAVPAPSQIPVFDGPRPVGAIPMADDEVRIPEADDPIGAGAPDLSDAGTIPLPPPPRLDVVAAPPAAGPFDPTAPPAADPPAQPASPSDSGVDVTVAGSGAGTGVVPPGGIWSTTLTPRGAAFTGGGGTARGTGSDTTAWLLASGIGVALATAGATARRRLAGARPTSDQD